MTDFEKLTTLLRGFNVPFTVVTERKSRGKIVYIGRYNSGYGDLCESVEGDKDKVKRYTGFYSCYSFDAKGKFEYIGIYE